MNAMLSWMRRHQITKVIFSLLMVALIAGTTGCVGEVSRTVKYDLTITSGAGGSVTVPGEGTFVCDSGRVVDLVATQASGYRFVNWTGNVATIANPNSPSTTITMDGDYSITATFEETEGTYYTLTVDVTGSGSVGPTAGQHTYGAGAVISISATPADGYHFVNWTGNVGTVANVNAASTTITMNSDYSITANFEQTAVTYYTLTMAATGGGSINPAVGQHSYAAGTAVPIIASAAGGYYFVNWTGSVGTIANVNAASTSITMNGNYSITANFEVALPYTLTMAVSGSGSTSPAVGQHTYTAGTPVPISATPAGGDQFVNWTAPAGSFTNAGSASTTFTMPAQDVTVTANFGDFPPIPPSQYTLTMTVTGSGSTSPAVGQHTYTGGTMVPIIATAAGGYTFVNWTAPAGSFTNASSATTTFTMPAQDVTVTAHFELAPTYALTMAATPPGSGTATDQTGAGPYQAGAQVSIKAQAAAGYHFVNWTATAGSFGSAGSATTTFTMPAQDVTVTAHFELAPTYALTMAATPPGSGTATDQTGAGPYQAGAQVSIKAQVAAGYYFVNWTATAGSFGSASAAQTTFTMPAQAVTVTARFEGINFIISAGERHTVGLKSDGTVVAVGDSGHGQCNVGSWTNIVQVAAGDYRTVGLKSNGTVVAVGANDYGECNTGGWTNMVQVSTGGYHTVGLRSNGTVAAVGDNGIGQCNVGSWTNIVQVAAGLYHTVGVKSDGTVVAVGYNDQGQCNVGSWTNIVQVAAGLYHTVGVKSDGTVVAVGYNNHGQCNVGGWTDIIHVAAGWYHTAGTKSDGTVVAVGPNWWDMCNVSSWADIVQVGAGAYHTVGVNSDGTVVAVGANLWGQCYVGDWDLN